MIAAKPEKRMLPSHSRASVRRPAGVAARREEAPRDAEEGAVFLLTAPPLVERQCITRSRPFVQLTAVS
ncbi:hypothetical protein GCM10009746_06120 [Microbacterium paludicola]